MSLSSTYFSTEKDTYAYEEEQERIALAKALHQPIKVWYNSSQLVALQVLIKLASKTKFIFIITCRRNLGRFHNFGKILLIGSIRKKFKNYIFI